MTVALSGEKLPAVYTEQFHRPYTMGTQAQLKLQLNLTEIHPPKPLRQPQPNKSTVKNGPVYRIKGLDHIGSTKDGLRQPARNSPAHKTT